MKNKFLSLLLSIIMIIPLVGCGGGSGSSSSEENTPNSDVDIPVESLDKNQVKVNMKYADYNNGVDFLTDQDKLRYNYRYCADLYGAGVYKLGSTVVFNVDLNEDTCSIKGWLVDDDLNRIENKKFNYRIPDSLTKKEITVYPILDLSDQTGGKATVKANFDGFTIREFINDNEILIEDINKIVVGSKTYKYVKETSGETTSEFFIDIETQEKNSVKDGVIALSNGTKNVIYTINRRDSQGNPLVLLPTTSYVDEKIDDVQIKDYTFLSDKNIGFDSVSDKFLNDINLNFTLENLLVSEGTANLNYYKYKGEIQNYKIKWYISYDYNQDNIKKHHEVEIDPITFKIPEKAYNVKFSAFIDKTYGITTTFIKEIIENTVYSEAYISDYSADSCLSATDSNVPVSEHCMYFKNIGNIDKKIKYPKFLKESEKNNIYYYAKNKDNYNNYNRIEGIELRKNVLDYFSFIKGEEKAYNVKLETNNLDQYNLRIMNIYKALLDKYSDFFNVLDIDYGYNPNNKSIVIDKLRIDQNTYYFNYIKTNGENYYHPSIDDIYHLIRQETSIAPVVINNNDNNPVIDEISKIIFNNIHNLFLSSKFIDDFKTKINNIIYYNTMKDTSINVNSPNIDFNQLRRYEIQINLVEGTYIVDFIDRSLPMSLLLDNNDIYVQDKYSYELSLIPYNETKDAFVNSNDNFWGFLNDYINGIKDYKTNTSLSTIYYDITSKNIGKNNEQITVCAYTFYSLNSSSPDYAFRLNYDKSNPDKKVLKSIDVLNIYKLNDNPVKTYLFINVEDTIDISTGSFTSVSDGVLTLENVNDKSVDKFTINSLYTFDYFNKKYIIDIANRSINEISSDEKNNFANKVATLNLNFSDKLKYYFTIDIQGKINQSFGLYAQKNGLSLHTIKITNNDINNPIVEQGSEPIPLENKNYIVVGFNYYEVKEEVLQEGQDPQKFVYINGERKPFDQTTKINLTTVKNGNEYIDIVDENKYNIFNLNNKLSSTVRIDKGKIFVAGQINWVSFILLYEDSEINNDYGILILKQLSQTENEQKYTIDYNGQEYIVTFETYIKN